ncbi:hypothetical protein NE237_007055 [Protea cynaroides]|uniref:Uncharacterized protein n=1 Tax=Protea cynaroides TaxID=273540 RepID=A0A9Q0KPF9_9MAGN|nr:hypothetical protein NE237_007055 [Protea cynaroides]
MAVNPVTIIRGSTYFARSIIFSRKTVSPLCGLPRIAESSQRSGVRVCSSCFLNTSSLNSNLGTSFKDLGHSGMKFRNMGLDYLRISAVSDGGVGGTGGVGGRGDGNSGGKGEDEGGRNNWSFLSWYLAALEKYPVLTKAITSALLTCIGDLICQLLIDQVSTLDLKRTFLFTFLGFVLVGPTLHFWYLYLSKLVTLPGASGALLRLVLDQFLFSPIFIGVFLSTLVTLEGRPAQVVPKLQQEWFSAVLANWQLWIPFQFLNFRFVPQQFQVLAANFVALAWNVILSFKAHKEVIVK